MKHTMQHTRILRAVLAALALTLAGCSNPVSPPADSGPAGIVTFTIGGGERAVLPSIDQFEKITLSFAAQDDAAALPDADIDMDTGSVTVEIRTAGSWVVSANAYVAGNTTPAAVSEAPKTLSWTGPGAEATVSGGNRFILKSAAALGTTGILKYTVTLPEELAQGAAGSHIRIEQGGAALASLDDGGFTDGEQAITVSIPATDLSLAPGLYVMEILIINDTGYRALYRKAVSILPGLITKIEFSPAATEFFDPATVAAAVDLGNAPFTATTGDGFISDIVFSDDVEPPTLDITAASTTEGLVFALAKTAEQVVSVGGTGAASVVLVAVGEESGDFTASETLAVFEVNGIDGNGKTFVITVTEAGKTGVTVEVTITREAAVMGFGLYSKARSAEESAYLPVSSIVGGETLDGILKHLAVAANITNDTSYLILLDSDQEIAPWSSDDAVSNVEITLRGIDLEEGENWKISWDETVDATAEGLFRVQQGTTLVLDNGITLDGKDTVIPGVVNLTVAMVYVKAPNTVTSDAVLIMREGSKITRAKSAITTVSGTLAYGMLGSAVSLYSQTTTQTNLAKFTMNGGEISGNEGYQAIVYNANSNVTVDGGAKITNNTLTKNNGDFTNGMGSAVYGSGFLLKDGEISNNTGRGVYVSSGSFAMEGGKITGNGTDATHSNGLSLPGAGLAVASNAIATVISGGEISGNGKADSLGSAILANDDVSLSGTVSIGGSIIVTQVKYISLDSSFNNTYGVIPVFLTASNSGNFNTNWKADKVVLQGMGETVINQTLVDKFTLAGGYLFSQTATNPSFIERDITGFYLKSDGTIGESAQVNSAVGFGDETFLSVEDPIANKIKSGDPEVELAAGVPYYLALENSSQYDGIAWYINGTKSAVTGSKLVLDTNKAGPAQVTVEADKDGVFDTGTFRFKVE